MTAPAVRPGDAPGIGGAAPRSAAALAARLAAERRALALRAGAMTALAALALVGIGVVLSALLLGDGRWMRLPRALPALCTGLTLAGAALLARWLHRRSREALAGPALAGAVEAERGLRAGSLRGALEVASHGALGARAAADVAARLPASGSLAPALATRATRALLAAAGAWLGAVTVAAGADRVVPDGLRAALNPVAAWRGTLLPALGWVALPVSVPRGMPLTVRIAAVGRDTITVSWRAAGEAWRDTTLAVDAGRGEAALPVGRVTAPVSLRATDGRAALGEVTVGVDDRGWIGDLVVQADFPAYLGRAPELLDAGDVLRIPRGTALRVRATLHGGARDAFVTDGRDTARFGGTGERSVAGEGTVAVARVVADRDGAWRWGADVAPRADGVALPAELPDPLRVAVVPDQPPRIAIVAPAADTAIAATGLVPIVMDAGDDHGVAEVLLELRIDRAVGADAAAEAARDSAAGGQRLSVAAPGAPLWSGGATVPLDGLRLAAGDRVRLVAVALDGSPWRQAARSAEVVLRVPTLSEQRELARALADSLAARATRAAAAERALQQATANASRSRELQGGGRPEGAQASGAARAQGEPSRGGMTFSAAERARQLAREQQQLGSRVDSMRQSARELEERLKSAGALDRDLQQRMADVQRLLREAMTPEMQRQLAQLEQSADRLSGTEARQSLEQLAQQQRQMREQLEKSAEMLRRAALEGAMQTLRDEARELAEAERRLAQSLGGDGPRAGEQSPGRRDASRDGARGAEDPRALADRSRALEREVERLAQRLEEAGAKPGASRTRAAQPMADAAADAMQRAAEQAGREAADRVNPAGATDSARRAPDERREPGSDTARARTMPGERDRQAVQPGERMQADQQQQGAAKQSGTEGPRQQGAQAANADAGPPSARAQTGSGRGERPQAGGQQAGGERAPSAERTDLGAGDRTGQQGGQRGQGGSAAAEAQRAADAMDRAARQLADAREAQVDAWKAQLAEQLDQSINETMQLARQQRELEERLRQQGVQAAQAGMQGEQGAVQQGVQQAAERLESAGRSSSLVSQRSQRAMGEAQRRVAQATQAMGSAGQPGGAEQAQAAMRDASDALNQALASLVRDRERVNQAGSASGFSEMLEQLRQLAQQQGALNGQMQGLNLLPGGAQGQQAQQQARVLARQQREVARGLMDVSDADASGRTDALAREAAQVAQQMERGGLDPSVAARQQQLYRRLLDAGRFLEQDERDDTGPREARAGSGTGGGGAATGPASGRAANQYAPPTWNDLRGLGPEERRLVIEYFRRINGGR